MSWKNSSKLRFIFWDSRQPFENSARICRFWKLGCDMTKSNTWKWGLQDNKTRSKHEANLIWQQSRHLQHHLAAHCEWIVATFWIERFLHPSWKLKFWVTTKVRMILRSKCNVHMPFEAPQWHRHLTLSAQKTAVALTNKMSRSDPSIIEFKKQNTNLVLIKLKIFFYCCRILWVLVVWLFLCEYTYFKKVFNRGCQRDKSQTAVTMPTKATFQMCHKPVIIRTRKCMSARRAWVLRIVLPNSTHPWVSFHCVCRAHCNHRLDQWCSSPDRRRTLAQH